MDCRKAILFSTNTIIVWHSEHSVCMWMLSERSAACNPFPYSSLGPRPLPSLTPQLLDHDDNHTSVCLLPPQSKRRAINPVRSDAMLADAVYLFLPSTGKCYYSILYADASSRCHCATWWHSGTLVCQLHLLITLNMWQCVQPLSVHWLAMIAAQQANKKSCGSTRMDWLSFLFSFSLSRPQIHATFCWGSMTAVSMRALCLFPPVVVPSRAVSGPVPSDMLDGRDNLHLSSWVSGLYYFRRSAAFTSAARPGKPIFCSCVQACVICNMMAALRFWPLPCKHNVLMLASDSRAHDEALDFNSTRLWT